MSLSWDLPTNTSVLDKVQVRHQARGETTWEPWTDLAADATTHTVANLKNGQDYLFEVRAESASGAGPAARTAGTPKLAVPEAPGNLTAAPRRRRGRHLTWDLPPTPAKSTRCRWHTVSPARRTSCPGSTWRRTPPATTSPASPTAPSTTFIVRALNGAGRGAEARVDATPEASPGKVPSAPADLAATAGDTKVSLAWTQSRDNSITKYQFRYAEGASVPGTESWTDIAGSGAGTTGHEVTGLTNDTLHAFEIRAVNANGAGAASAVTATPKLAIPEAPGNLTAAPGDGKVGLTWDLPTNTSEIDRMQVAYKLKERGDLPALG